MSSHTTLYYARGQRPDGTFKKVQGPQSRVRRWVRNFPGDVLEFRRLP